MAIPLIQQPSPVFGGGAPVIGGGGVMDAAHDPSVGVRRRHLPRRRGRGIRGASMSGANSVNQQRLWQRHADMAKLGGTPKGGVNRQALSPEDAAARNQLAGWAKARGFGIFTDPI